MLVVPRGRRSHAGAWTLHLRLAGLRSEVVGRGVQARMVAARMVCREARRKGLPMKAKKATGIWWCACGRPQKGKVCTDCRTSREEVARLDAEKLAKGAV